MNLRIKFSQVCRRMLTPIRKHLIYKKIIARIKDKEVIQYLKTSKLNLELVFTNRVINDKRKFGVILAANSNTVILRCGCANITRWGNALVEAKTYHEGITIHGGLLREPKIVIDEPKRKPRTSGNTQYDKMVEAMKMTENISQLINERNSETTIIKPLRATRRKIS